MVSSAVPVRWCVKVPSNVHIESFYDSAINLAANEPQADDPNTVV
jgi:hypothetical protein